MRNWRHELTDPWVGVGVAAIALATLAVSQSYDYADPPIYPIAMPVDNTEWVAVGLPHGIPIALEDTQSCQ